MTKISIYVMACTLFSCNAHSQATMDLKYPPSNTPRVLTNAEQTKEYSNPATEVAKLFADAQYGKYVKALLVLRHNGSILLERYRDGIQDDMPHRSMSMAKSITAIGFGKAACERSIDLNSRVSTLIPELTGHIHGEATIRHVLTMTTGGPRTNALGWYSEADEWHYHSLRASGLDVLKRPANLASPHGARLNYAGYNTIMLGYLVSRSTGVSFVDYFQKKIWSEMGAEHIGGWSRSRDGEAKVTGNAFMTLRDYGRFGLYVLDVLHGERGDPCFQNFVREATRTQIAQTEYPYNSYRGYGYQIWTDHSAFNKGSFAFLGHLGQRIYINPNLGLVVVMLVDGPAEAEARLAGYGNRIFSGFEKAILFTQMPNQ